MTRAPVPHCAVIITVRPQDTPGDAAGCVAALRAQLPAPVVELFVVGRLTAADAAALADPAAQPPLTICPDPNLSAARNAALHAATAPVVAFLDADGRPAADWLPALLAPMADPAVVGVKGTYATRQRAAVARFVQAEYEEKYDRLRRRARIDFIDMYSAAYRRDVLLANGGFDEQFPLLSDRELAFRLAARGYRLAFAPEAVVYHDHATTPAAYWRSKFATGFWNAQVVRRFPERGWTDSHTPQLLKVQMVLVALLGPAALLAFTPLLPAERAALPATVTALLLLASLLPLALRALRQGVAAGLAALPLQVVRALALTTGYGLGVIRPKPGITGRQSTIGGTVYLAKRLLDIVGGLIGTLLLLLLTPVVALAVKLDSPGPVFFRQERIGQGGRPFTIYKFRSMRRDAEAQLDALIDVHALSEPVFKLDNDPRITRSGRWLRRTSLDELPQFWNVLKGEMSLVGPRPEESRIVARYNDWHRRRLAVKPGMSGPMQVNGRADLSLDERVRLELDYIENYSLGRDLAILWRTLPVVWRGDGAR